MRSALAILVIAFLAGAGMLFYLRTEVAHLPGVLVAAR